MKTQQFESLTQSPRNLRWAYNHYDNFEMYMGFSFMRRNETTYIRSKLHQYGYLYTPEISISPTSINFTCQCYFNTPSNACGHVLATILLYEDLDIPKNILSFTDDDFVNTINERIKQREIQRQKEFEQKQFEKKISYGKNISKYFLNQEKMIVEKMINKELYHLEFEIHIDTRNVFNNKTEYVYNDFEEDYVLASNFDEQLRFEIRAKVGREKLYVIKNWSLFMDLIEQEKSHRYGIQLEFIHTTNAFEKEVQDLLPKLNKLMTLDNEGYSVNRDITLSTEHLYDIYNTFKDYPSEYLDITISEEDFEIVFDVTPVNDLYSVSLNTPFDFFESQNEFFIAEYHTITHLLIENENLKHLVLEIYKNDNIVFSFNDLNTILLSLKDENIIVNGFDVIESKPLDISIYIDIDEDDLVIKGRYIADGKEHNILKNDTNNTYIDKVLYVLESFQSYKDEHKMLMSLKEEKTYRFLEEGITHLEGLCTVFADESLKNIQRPTSLNLSIGVTMDNGLLELDINSVQMDSDEIYDVLNQFRRKKRYYKLKSGEVINLESKDMEELDDFVNSMSLTPKDLKEGNLRVPIYRTLQLENKSEELESITFDVSKELNIFNENFKKHSLESMSLNTYEEILKDYQKHGVKWLLLLKKYGFNGILADDMGLGKTLQVIAMLENTERNKPSIVICPASLLFNWEDELHKFNSKLSYSCIHGPKANRDKLIKESFNKDLIITTYDYLRSDFEEYKDYSFSNIIIDEAQYIKNLKTLTAKAVKSLSGLNRIALTGTPIENSLAELWSIFDFLMPGYLYSYSSFKKNFETPIVKDNDEKKQKILRSMVEPFILRRVKKDVLLDLPDKIEKTLRVEFNEEEEKLYTAKLIQGNKDVQKILNADKIDSIQILKLLGELRQLCCDPRMMYADYPHVSSKMKACVELVEPMKENNQKVLIFSSFTKTLDLLELELKKKNIKYHMLTGSNSKEERKELVHEFQHDDSTVFLISLKAAGVGLNLTAAENVIHFDPWWNVAAENQASDRAHRIGQTKSVSVFKLIMRNSIEEKILKMQERKQDMADIFVEGASGSFASLSKDDILDLFNR